MNPYLRVKGIEDYLAIFLKRWQVAAIAFLSIFAIVFFLTLRKEYSYQAKAKIMIGEAVGQRALANTFNDFRNYFYEQQAFSTYPYILNSKPVATGIATRLEWIDPEKEKEEFASLISSIRGSVSIQRISDSRLFSILANHSDPQKAQEIANAAADIFIEQNLQQKLDTFRKSISWLADQLIDLEYKLEESQKELIDYIAAERVTSFGEMPLESKTLASGQEGLDSASLLSRLQNLKVEQDLQVATLLQRYTEKHPKVIQARKTLSLTKQKLSTEGAIKKQQDQERDSETIRVKQKEIKYSILKRKVDINKELYNSLISKMKQIDIASAINDNNMSVMEYAEIPRSPVRPNKKRQIFFGFVIALGFAISLPFIMDFLDPTLQTVDEVENYLSLPVLSSIPVFDSQDGNFPALRPQSTTAEAFRKLRTNVRFAFAADSGRSLLVTSSGPGEGKSTVVTNLALTLAASGNRVCVIDTDLRIPRLHKLFELPNEKGLTNFLVGEEKNLDHVIQESGFENLWVITSGQSTPKPAELLETEKMQQTLAELRKRYDHILCDSPPAGTLIDPSILSGHLDGLIFVLQPGRIKKTHIKATKAQLERVKSNICGIVLNKVEIPKKGSYYYYYYLRDKASPDQKVATVPPPENPATEEATKGHG